ncbi:MAG: COX15/CtaA family protein [Bacteroidia bacterium]|jgi:cytochrome c oxidase assembly protein subunit 15|nr:COX15/CtaA family protein [Bacteroidia bacterium]
MINQNPNKSVIYWLLTGCSLIYIMVVVGCITRLTHSGLSITDWSFMGSIPPLSEADWLERFMKYQQSPEFLKVNFSMKLDEFKHIFFWEYIHRMIGRTMMYVFSIGLIILLIRKKIKKEMTPSLILLFFMGAMQAVIGWWMVYSGLQDKPAVSHFRLATHLMSAFTLFAFTFWFALKLIYPKDKIEKGEGVKLKWWLLSFFVVLILQIIYGAFTAGFVEGNAAKIRPGHIFNSWPKMGDSWMPEQVTMKESFYLNFFENASGIQFVHRTLAIALCLLLAFIWYKSNKLQLNSNQYQGITFLIYGITIQFILGVFTLVYQVPVVLGVLHQTGAFFLFASSVYLMYHSFKKPKA